MGLLIIQDAGAATPPVAPTLVSATVLSDGVTLRLVFNSFITAGSATNGLSRSVGSITSGSYSGARLNLVIPKIYAGANAGTISYNAASGDLAGAGGDVASFSGVSITNNSTQVAPSVTLVKWSTVDKNSLIAVDGTGYIASLPVGLSQWVMGRADTSFLPADGDHSVFFGPWDGSDFILGFASDATTIFNYLGYSNNGYGYRPFDGTKFTAGNSFASGTGPCAPGDVIEMQYFPALAGGTIKMKINNGTAVTLFTGVNTNLSPAHPAWSPYYTGSTLQISGDGATVSSSNTDGCGPWGI